MVTELADGQEVARLEARENVAQSGSRGQRGQVELGGVGAGHGGAVGEEDGERDRRWLFVGHVGGR